MNRWYETLVFLNKEFNFKFIKHNRYSINVNCKIYNVTNINKYPYLIFFKCEHKVIKNLISDENGYRKFVNFRSLKSLKSFNFVLLASKNQRDKESHFIYKLFIQTYINVSWKR